MNETTNWLEDIWEHREEVLYPSLFGKDMEGIYPIPHNTLRNAKLEDPRWSTCGVFRFAPTETRSSWLYVSSGLSNAWFDDEPNPNESSGFGCEFILESPVEAKWPVQRLHQIMSLQIGYTLGKYGDPSPLEAGDRLPAGCSIDFKESKLTEIILTDPSHVVSSFQQDSGHAQFIQVVGITYPELVFAKTNSTTALIELLRSKTSFPVTEPDRNCTIPP